MQRVRLIHWNEAEARERAKLLRAAGYDAAFAVPLGPGLLRELRENKYAAVVIDLGRLPSHGREIALGIRYHKSTRHLPLVFLGGDPEKVARIRRLLPDATYTEWSRVRGALRQAIAHPPAQPVVTRSVFDAYAATPLVKKLGIQPNSVVRLAGAPPNFRKTLGKLPAGARLRKGLRPGCHLALWFARSRRELDRGLRKVTAGVASAPLWVIWPKKSSAMQSDLAQQVVREALLARGWVDYKICAVDKTWSGLLFRRRKRAR